MQFGYLIWKNGKFNKLVFHLTVDKSQNITSAGMPGLKGKAPHWPCYRKLNFFHALLPKQVSVSSLSDNINPFTQWIIDTKLSMHSNTVQLVGPLNWPNITYASWGIIDSVSIVTNFKFPVPKPYPTSLVLDKTIVFVHTKAISQNGSHYVNSRLPPKMQYLKITHHYYGGMSAKYLKETHDRFISNSNPCSILFVMKGAATVSICF